MLEVSGLSKIYRKGSLEIPALRDVSLTVDQGEFLSIVGRSGSGKSTLLNLIGGLDTATSGAIVFNDRDLTRMKPGELAVHRRSSVGMVFQSFNLVPHRTALENVMLALVFGGTGRQERGPKARELLTSLGLAHRLAHRPGEMSGGEAQRVAIARALANRPAMLLLDEPTGNLDSTTSEEIMSLVKHLNRSEDLTVLMVTHEQDMAESVSHKIIRMLDGRIADKSDHGKAL
ncbi:MAG: ABC transporter ATP-binding protein [Candidatus Eisenbacteria bacterium]